MMGDMWKNLIASYDYFMQNFYIFFEKTTTSCFFASMPFVELKTKGEMLKCFDDRSLNFRLSIILSQPKKNDTGRIRKIKQKIKATYARCFQEIK